MWKGRGEEGVSDTGIGSVKQSGGIGLMAGTMCSLHI